MYKANVVERDATGIVGALARRNEAVGKSLTVRSFAAGETVCEAHEMAKAVALVASGRVQLYRTSRDGRSFVVSTLGPGSMFGEACLLGGETRATHAVGLEPCTVWMMPARAALEISAEDAMFGFGLLQAMGQRVMEAENRLEQMAFRTVASRLAALLLELAGDDPHHVVRATHQELGDMLGTWRETISKTLQDFRRKGLVASGHRRLIVLDREGLEAICG